MPFERIHLLRTLCFSRKFFQFTFLLNSGFGSIIARYYFHMLHRVYWDYTGSWMNCRTKLSFFFFHVCHLQFTVLLVLAMRAEQFCGSMSLCPGLSRITESSELEGDFKGHLLQFPCNKQGHLWLEQVAQSPVLLDPECLQGWGIKNNTENIKNGGWK